MTSRYDCEELKKQLQTMLLNCCCTKMEHAIDSLVKCYRFGMTLEISGKLNPGYSLLIDIANYLGVKVLESDGVKTDPQSPYGWMSDPTTTNIRSVVPHLSSREGDFHLIWPFYVNWELAELKKLDSGFRTPKFDNLYVILMWSEFLSTRSGALAARARRDLLAFEKTGVMCARNYPDATQSEFTMVRDKLMKLPELTQLYLGFWQGKPGLEMARKFGTFVSFNEKWEKDLSSLMRKDMSMVSPVVVRHKVWDVNDLTIISRNAWAQKDIYFKLVEEERVKMKECLLLRVADTPEVEIAKSMQFESDENYNKWLVSHELDVNPSRFPSPVDGWQAACMYFGYKPDIRLLESAPPEELLHSFTNQVRVLVSPDDGLKDDKSLQVTGEFRHSEDFRNVVTPLGEEFLLSGGQAEVIRLLHEGAERKTPWLSDAFLIEEVFQEVKEKKLKKLFGNESAWRALTERGNKKSLLRLKDWNVPDSDKTNSEKFAAHKEFSVYQ